MYVIFPLHVGKVYRRSLGPKCPAQDGWWRRPYHEPRTNEPSQYDRCLTQSWHLTTLKNVALKIKSRCCYSRNRLCYRLSSKLGRSLSTTHNVVSDNTVASEIGTFIRASRNVSNIFRFRFSQIFDFFEINLVMITLSRERLWWPLHNMWITWVADRRNHCSRNKISRCP